MGERRPLSNVYGKLRIESRQVLGDALGECGEPCGRSRAELDRKSTSELNVLAGAEIYAMIDSVGDALNSASPDRLRTLYEQLRAN